jgi:hypothetical protein
MPGLEPVFHESKLLTTPIRDLGLNLAETRLAPLVAELEDELRRAGFTRLRPTFYLASEWGVPFPSTSIAIPFYLARPDLTALHAEYAGHVEGVHKADILRYLRHEMGHVVNYAYRLYEQQEWVKLFGAFTQPYREEYRPEPFSRRFVRHLPGWYAQKHPDEDWAETFAVWLTPGSDWRRDYAGWPDALAKLEYCDRTLDALKDREPLPFSATEDEEEADELAVPLGSYYHQQTAPTEEMPPGLDGALRAIFEDLGDVEAKGTDVVHRPAAALIRDLEGDLLASVYRWTGHFPERTRPLLRYLAQRADQLGQVYPVTREKAAIVALTTVVTALALNYVHRGSYFP